jgi:DNA-binding MarR family transcriptional regulator
VYSVEAMTQPARRRHDQSQEQAAIMDKLTKATLARFGDPYKTILHMNQGLIHVLEIIEQAPNGGKISTRELLRQINSDRMHKLLKRAEELGYVKREAARMPEGKKGGTMVVNSLTAEGRELLRLAKKYPPSKH